MYNDGTSWKGYGLAFPATDPNGPIISATEPTTQSDGTTALSYGDLWIDTSDLDNYPKIYVYDGTNWKPGGLKEKASRSSHATDSSH